MAQRNPGLKPWAILLSHFMATPFTAFSTLVQPLQASRSFSAFAPSDRPLALSVPGVLKVIHHSIAV
jgi:hypothetical protein